MHPSIPKLVELVRASETDDATALFATIASEVTGDRERTIATMRAIARELVNTSEDAWMARVLGTAPEPVWIARALRAARDAAWDDISPTGVERVRALVFELAEALDDNSDVEGLAELDRDLVHRLAGQRALVMRLDLAKRFASNHEFRELNLRTAVTHATTDLDRICIATERCRQLRDAIETANALNRAAPTDTHATVLAELVALANRCATDQGARDAVIRADLEIGASDPVLAHRHLSRAEELARSSADTELRIEATSAFAELLFDAELLERADAVASTLPHTDDLPPILAHIRRVRGLLSEPPPEAFVAPPEEVVDELAGFKFFGVPTHSEGLTEYFTRDANLATAIMRVVSPEKIREWSHGPVKTIADLESQKIFGPVRSYACACGRYLGARYRGVVCQRCRVEVIDRVTRTVRAAHIQLAERVVHPWHASTIAKLLDEGVREVEHADVAVLVERLEDLEDRLIEQAEKLRYRRLTDPRLVVMDTMIENGIRPTWFVLEMVPVWPPESPLLSDREAVRRAYIEVLDGVDVKMAVGRLFSLISKQVVPRDPVGE